MTVARDEEKSRLGEGAAFARTPLRGLRQEEETWEADFRAVPKPGRRSPTEYRGMAVARDGSLLAESRMGGRPTVNDMATLLANAMRQPLTGRAYRPRHIHVRGHPQWKELFPHLTELGIAVAVQRELPKVENAYLKQRREAYRADMVKPTGAQAAVEALFPAIAKWVQEYGRIEIGDQESVGFTVMAIDDGGVVFEDDKPDTLAEAMAALEKGLAEYFEREGIE